MTEFREITTGLMFPEGPIAMPDGSVILVEIERQTLTRVHPDGRQEVIAETGGGPNGAALGPDGKFYICNNGGFNWGSDDGVNHPTAQAENYVSGSIQRVDIDTVEIGTRSGGRIGRTEDWIRNAWPNHIQASPLPDGSGNLLAFVPQDESDQEFRIMFQTDGEKVIRMWAGRLPWAAELGGCPVG